MQYRLKRCQVILPQLNWVVENRRVKHCLCVGEVTWNMGVGDTESDGGVGIGKGVGVVCGRRDDGWSVWAQ